MLVGYVSDERYVAIPEVLLEFEADGESIEARSRATGAVYADVTPGLEYKVTLACGDFGFKSVYMTPGGERPYHFRLLRDGLMGYMWPKWVRSGEKSEFRVHAVEAYKLELYRYGWKKEFIRNIGWYDEHGPRATMQITPDGDYTRTGVRWNTQGYTNPAHKQYIEAPERSGLYYLHASTESGVFFSFPWIVAPAEPSADVAVLAANINWNAYNNFGGRSNYIHPDEFPPHAHGQCPVRSETVHRLVAPDVQCRRLRAPVLRPTRTDQPCPAGRRRHGHDQWPRGLPRRACGVAIPGVDGA